LEAATIFLDVFAVVPIGEAEVEDFFVSERADAAGAGAEGVNQPGKFGKCGDQEDFDAVGGACGPGVGVRADDGSAAIAEDALLR